MRNEDFNDALFHIAEVILEAKHDLPESFIYRNAVGEVADYICAVAMSAPDQSISRYGFAIGKIVDRLDDLILPGTHPSMEAVGRCRLYLVAFNLHYPIPHTGGCKYHDNFGNPDRRIPGRRRCDELLAELFLEIAESRENVACEVELRRIAVPHNLRISIFERDGYRCQICGANKDDGKLEIDHIHPVAKGGTNAITNLQVLCRDCNIGKGDSILEVPANV